MTAEPVGHSPNRHGQWHTLADHCRGTSRRCERFAAAFGLSVAGRLVGLLHDVGKAPGVWQAGLARAAATGGRVGVDHKTAGAVMLEAVSAARGWDEWLPLPLVAFSHHGGLLSPAEYTLAATARRRHDPAALTEALTWTRQTFRDELTLLAPDVPQRFDPWAREMLTRLVYSCLIDADRLDTEAHFTGTERAVPPSVSQKGQRFWQALPAHTGQPCAAPVKALRQDLMVRARVAAQGPQGMFVLDAPTGAAKTLAGLGFAFDHAAAHPQVRRVIMAAPFNSILDQSAAIVTSMIGRAGVLTHFGDAVDDRDGVDNWDAPVILTSMVQLFDSLFAAAAAKTRKLHRIAGSVVILDEVQSIPEHVLVPVLDALRILVTHAGVTVLLMSATQPDFWQISPFRDLPATVIRPDPSLVLPPRVRFSWWPGPRPTLAQVAERVRSHHQAVVVLNTTRDAATVAAAIPGALHLSARMRPVDRTQILDQFRADLAQGQRVILVATAVIEAGVNLDFPAGYRALTHPASVIQLGGRVNRDGLLPGVGELVVFDPVDGSTPPGVPQVAAGLVPEYFGPGVGEFDDSDQVHRFWVDLWARVRVEHQAEPVQRSREAMDFPTTARLFAVIADQTHQVLVAPDDPAVTPLLQAYQASPPGAPRRRALAALAPYMVSLRAQEVDQGRDGPRPVITQVAASGADPGTGILIHHGPYDPVLGLAHPPSARKGRSV